MITFRKGLFVGYSAIDDRKKIIDGIRKGRLQLDIYVIVLSACPSDIFDIIPAFMLNGDSYKGRDIHILGIARGRRGALHLAGTMVLKAMESAAPADIRRYYSAADEESEFLEPEYQGTDFEDAEDGA